MAAAEGEESMGELCFDVVAVLPAGGCGVRMNMELPKQVYNHSLTLKIKYTSLSCQMITVVCIVTEAPFA